MKSQSLIEKQLRKKTNPELIATIIAAKKNKAWLNVAGLLSGSRKNNKNINLREIDQMAKEKETIIVPGKILSQGELNKKIKIAALNFSEKAKEKITKSGSEGISILQEIKLNPGAKGIKIIR